MVSKNDFINGVKNNKELIGTLLVIFVIMGTYYWHVYSEYKKTKDQYQKARVAAICPDYWENISDGKSNTQRCKNVKKIGRCNLLDTNNIKDFSAELYEDPIAKCKWSKYCRAPWEGVSNLCADVDVDL